VRDAGGSTGSLLEMAAGIGRARTSPLCFQDCFDGAFGRAVTVSSGQDLR
jgi:hypothetical protein